MENKRKTQLYNAGIRILQACKNELYLSMRFLDVALNFLGYRMDMRTFFIGTDGENLYFQPRFLAERYAWHPVLANRAYLHSVLHCIFHHPFEEEAGDGELWNLSCDIAVEYVTDSLELPAVEQVIPELRQNLYRRLEKELPVLSAQAVYQYLKNAPVSAGEREQLAAQFLVDDHGYWKQAGKKGEDSDESKKEEPDSTRQEGNKELEDRQQKEKQKTLAQHWQRVGEQTQMRMETDGSRKVPVHLLQQLRVENRERFSYREFLRKFAARKEVMRVDTDSFDNIYYCYGLEHYGNLPLVEPLEYKEVKEIDEFVIVIDTSGSCSGRLVKEFLQQTCDVLFDTESFSRKINIHILQCDDRVQEDIVIKSTGDWRGHIENFTVKGLGKTDFRPAFSYVEGLQQKGELKKLKGMLYFTDGYGTFPSGKPPFDTVFVFLDEYYNDRDVPVWAMKLHISAMTTEESAR